MWSLSLLFLLGLTTALPQQTRPLNRTDSSAETAKSTVKNCTDGIFSATCLKIEILTLLEKLNSKHELTLLPGVAIVKESETNDTGALERLARAFPGEPEERLNRYLLYRVGNYLDTHAVKLSLDEAKESVGAARKKDKKGGMDGLMTAAMMLKGTLISVALGGLALLAGKALMTALMSLMLSAVIGLKSLTSGGGKSTTYEIVSKPVYSHAHSHSTAHEDAGYGGHSGYGRAIEGKVTRRRR